MGFSDENHNILERGGYYAILYYSGTEFVLLYAAASRVEATSRLVNKAFW